MKASSETLELIRLLCDTAKKGLINCYPRSDDSNIIRLPQARDAVLSMASHLRYLVIAQIGIKRWESFKGKDESELPDFWNLILKRRNEINGVGDFGLAIWAGVEGFEEELDYFADGLSSGWLAQSEKCNAVELAWIVQGLTRLAQSEKGSTSLDEILKQAHQKLLALYVSQSRLFARHSRKGIVGGMSARIACFADQIYPVLAMANYGRRFSHQQSVEAACAVADRLCELQGPLGQWWWHYDTGKNVVAEQYPVFSVHQDGMAPMALLALDEVAGTDHSRYIEAGLNWLIGPNELNLNMIQPQKGIVWRDIHRREVAKAFRFVRDGLSLSGWGRAHRVMGKRWFGYVVNKECRPYQLGWILYAWAPLFC